MMKGTGAELWTIQRATYNVARGAQEAEVRPAGLCQRCTYSGTADTTQKRIKYLYITEATLACLW